MRRLNYFLLLLVLVPFLTAQSPRSDFAAISVIVDVPGTPVQVPSNTNFGGFNILIKAKTANVGVVRVGPNASSTSFSLMPCDSITYKLDNTNRIWVDADNGGDGIEITVER